MNRPYSYDMTPRNTYKGGLGSVAPYPLNPDNPDITTLPLRSEFADIAKYGGIQLLTASGTPSINAPSKFAMSVPDSLMQFVETYKWWIIVGAGIGLIMNLSRPRYYGR